MNNVTSTLSRMFSGDPSAAHELLPLVYDELRKLAAVLMSRERSGQTLQATALVHEAFMRLVDVNSPTKWNSRGHFFAAAAQAMRRIMVENARRKQRRQALETLENGAPQPIAIEMPELREDVLALDDALNRLASEDPTAAELVQLRYFAGLTLAESAEVLKISPRSADRKWVFAKAWLHDQISR
ncbi:MAG: sigma-70 family RNA polymerase sigma factor [Planctomycetes bacterium]|nr:sigma-70 family RNA polymerase sigma factor [Planctomycetota bacterium]